MKSSQIDVRVLGTEFNFNNYTPDNTQVALVSGKVEILSPEGSGLATLSPGEAAVCGADGTVEVENVDTYALTQWVEGFFYFDDVPLIDVLRELGPVVQHGSRVSQPRSDDQESPLLGHARRTRGTRNRKP